MEQEGSSFRWPSLFYALGLGCWLVMSESVHEFMLNIRGAHAYYRWLIAYPTAQD
jgi:hypothetical protein